ncbi:hypothetical protein K469DRAFT_645875, partial [Zopfia rhizophila CBS 207.26]
MDNLTPSDLFSPSKARQQRVQAQDWAQIESWLSYKYCGRTIPTFERNEDTLKALRALSIANERADEERVIKERLEREALKESEETKRHPEDSKILKIISANLTPEGQQSLAALSTTSTLLNTPSSNPETIAHTLIHHSSTSQTLNQHLDHLHIMQKYLSAQLTLLRTQLSELQTNPAFTAPSSLQRQTTEQNRQIKHLRSKIREYEDKLSSISLTQDRNRGEDVGSAEAIASMLDQQVALDELRDQVERLEDNVGKYAGLPADKEAARKEVGKLEVELDAVRRRRDGLFEGLIGR